MAPLYQKHFRNTKRAWGEIRPFCLFFARCAPRAVPARRGAAVFVAAFGKPHRVCKRSGGKPTEKYSKAEKCSPVTDKCI